jgi:C2 domain
MQFNLKRAIGSLVCATALSASALTAANAAEIVVNISQVKALDKLDLYSRGDLFAKVTIAGETFTTAIVRNRNEIKPDWVIRKQVASGTHDVKIEIFDKDVTKDEPIDINRLPAKRDLDFKVNTRRCTISGFSTGYRCKDQIERSGDGAKKSLIMFSVDATR